MEGGLAQPHTRHATRCGPVDHGLHQPAPDSLVLDSGIDRYRPDPDDRGSFIQEVAADDIAIALSAEGKSRGNRCSSLDGAECVVTDATTRGGIVGRGRAQRIHGLTSLTIRNYHMCPRRSVNRYVRGPGLTLPTCLPQTVKEVLVIFFAHVRRAFVGLVPDVPRCDGDRLF
jgi:hypothetical protein